MSGAAAKERSRGSCAPRLISRRCWPPRDNSEKPGPYCSPSLVNSLRDLMSPISVSSFSACDLRLAIRNNLMWSPHSVFSLLDHFEAMKHGRAIDYGASSGGARYENAGRSSSDLATLANELEFAVVLEDRFGDEKIDVIVRGPGHSPRGIDDVAVRTGIVL
jgi:hypothetical protein